MTIKTPPRRRRRSMSFDQILGKDTEQILPNKLTDSSVESLTTISDLLATDTAAGGVDISASDVTNSDIWANKPKRGYFNGRPGPGRPASQASGLVSQDGLEGAGSIDLLAEMYGALTEVGVRKFCKTLLAKSPVSASQLIQHLGKLKNEQIEDKQITIIAGNMPLGGSGTTNERIDYLAEDRSTQAKPDTFSNETDALNIAGQVGLEAPVSPSAVEPQATWLCKVCPVERWISVAEEKCPYCWERRDGRKEPEQPQGRANRIGLCVSVGGDSNDGWEPLTGSLQDLSARLR